MAIEQKAIKTVYEDGSVVWSNLRNKKGIPVIGLNDTYTASRVTQWYDGTPMTDLKVDGKIWFKERETGEYFRVNLPNWGENFLEKDIVQMFRDMNPTEILLLRAGYYKGVKLNGYYTKGDTPGSIEYYMSATTDPDDGGSVFYIGVYKFEHKFTDGVDVRYFGAKLDGVRIDNVEINKACLYAFNNKVKIKGEGTALLNNTVTLPTHVDAPTLNFRATDDFEGVLLYIDNYRYDKPLSGQTADNMIRDISIRIGEVYNHILGKNIVGIKVNAARNIKVDTERMYGFKDCLLLEGYNSTGGWVAYNTFNVKSMINCASGIKMRQFAKDGVSVGWVTQNIFNGTEIKTPNNGGWSEVVYIDMQADAGNTFDGNTFNHLILEGAVDTSLTNRWAIITKRAISNTFISCRFEGYKNGAIKRILNEVSENQFPNTFIDMKSTYGYDIFDNYSNGHKKYYKVVAPALFNGNMNTSGYLSNSRDNIETVDFSDLSSSGISQFGEVITEKPASSSTDRGTGVSVVRSLSNGEREASFMLWTNNSSNNDLFFRKAKPSKTDGTNFKPNWFKFRMIDERNVEVDSSNRVPTSVQVPTPYNLMNYWGTQGIQTYVNGVWYNKYGYSGNYSGAIANKPTSATNVKEGDMYMFKTDTYRGFPIFYVGGTGSEDDKWVRADGELALTLRRGTTAQRPTARNAGTLFYNTTKGVFEAWNGDVDWVEIPKKSQAVEDVTSVVPAEISPQTVTNITEAQTAINNLVTMVNDLQKVVSELKNKLNTKFSVDKASNQQATS